MCALVVFTGGSKAHFLEGLKSNWRDPRQGENNGFMLQLPNTEWR